MILHASASLRCLAALTAVGVCVRPEKVDSLKMMFSTANAAPCGLEVFEALSTESTLGDARALFLAGCEEKYTSDECSVAAAELWSGRDLTSTSGLEMDSDLCEFLRLAVSASERTGLAQDSEGTGSLEASISKKLRRSGGSADEKTTAVEKPQEVQRVSQKADDAFPQCTNPTFMTLNKLPETGITGGRCMDGTTAGFYYNPPSGNWHASKTWVIFLEGGGLCYTEDYCAERAETHLGSNSTWGRRTKLETSAGQAN